MNDLQKGASEFYSIPIEEAMKGDQGSIWKGLQAGTSSLVLNSVGGVSNSLSRLSSTWFLNLKELAGRPV